MNYGMIIYILGYIMKVESAFMLIPMIISAFYNEKSVVAFIITIIILLVTGFTCTLKKPRDKVIYAKEGFIIVALAWVLMSIFGALPFYISRTIPSFVDCFFEVVSGFTTTGATILKSIEIMPKGILFWRSFTHWIGGMGVLVFVLDIAPLAGGRSIHIMRAEVPGPTMGKLVPKLKHTAIILYGIYIFLTVVLIVLLVLGGMPLYDSFIHAFGTAGTGGFSNKNISVGFYNSAYIEWVITVFMILFGINFNVYYFVLIKNFRKVFKNEELLCFLGIILMSIVLIAFNILPIYENVAESIRHSSFQVASIITTTGYATVDFNFWPEFSKSILVLLMFFGASAGSTGGGLKIARLIILFKNGAREIKRMIHPRNVSSIKLDGKIVDNETINGVNTYFTVYMMIVFFSVIILSLDGFSFATNSSAVISCMNNVGPGIDVVGPMGNYSEFSTLSKIILSVNMLIGRLEIYPMLVLLYPAVWKKI